MNWKKWLKMSIQTIRSLIYERLSKSASVNLSGTGWFR
ncbi:hypothetical protein GGR06_003082 [Bacteroides reticulotermitis]|uniref:Uncharacterized protein n=1 Tax=Bacteroides reticulotermitis TaxID=1133319 RepID=A0A840CZI7_9BACE|nr:hypothetical protein [Bacteroides reticulotermitis]